MTETGIAFARRWAVVGACCLLWLGGCRTEPDRWEDVELDVLERKRAALAGYLDQPESLGRLSNDGVLVVLRQELVRHAVQMLLPAHQTWGPLGVRFDSAHVDLGQGLAVLEVRGEVSLDEPRPMSADLTLLGVVEVSGVDRERGRLTRSSQFSARTFTAWESAPCRVRSCVPSTTSETRSHETWASASVTSRFQSDWHRYTSLPCARTRSRSTP